EVIAETDEPQKVLRAVVGVAAIAGLVAGASKGEGRGNQYRANIRETDAIAHVVRCFDDPNVIHVAGRLDPVSDIGTINTELALADLDAEERQLAKHEKLAQTGGDKEAQRLVSALRQVRQALDAGLPARSAELSKEERALLRPLFLLTMKPVMYVANIAEQGSRKFLEEVEAYAAREGAPVVPVSASIEAQIADMPEEDKKLFLEDMGMDEPGLNRVIRAAYQLLGLLITQAPGLSPIAEKQSEALDAILHDRSRGRIFVAREAGKVVGMASLLYTISTAEGGKAALFEDFIVQPEYRRQGIGTRLLEYVIQQARAEGVLRITLLTDLQNDNAQDLYRKLGFVNSSMQAMRLKLRKSSPA